jgi:hypothetical protein
VEHLKALGFQYGAKIGNPGRIPAWLIKARNQTDCDRIAAASEDDWN